MRAGADDMKGTFLLSMGTGVDDDDTVVTDHLPHDATADDVKDAL